MESVGQWLFFLVVIIFQVVQTESCEFGSYISGLTNNEACCVNCRTWDLYDRYFEDTCPPGDFPYVCKSDTGIFLEPPVEDVLTGTTTSASLQCHSIIVDCDEGMNSTSVEFNITTEGNIKDMSCTQQSGTVMELGSHLVICTATDAIKKTTLTCNFTARVIDNEVPQLQCKNVTLMTISGENYANVTYKPDVWDNSREMLKPNCSLVQGSRLSIGTHQVSCSVSDSSLNMNSCSGSVLVEDNENPKLECPNMKFTTITGEDYANVTYKPDVWDNSGATLEPNCSLVQGSRLLIGAHQVSCSVSDGSLNMNSCSGSVLVEDNEKPKLECPNMNLTTIPGEDYANVTYEPDVWDNSREMLKPNCSLAQGSRLSIGTRSVSCSVSDSSLNMNSCSGSVLVEEVSKVESKLSKPEIISIIVTLILAVLFIGVGRYCYLYFKRRKMMCAQNEVEYNPSNGHCVISIARWLIVENHGASFVDIMLSQYVKLFTKVDISWRGNKGRDTKTIKKEDFNKLLTINDLTANHRHMFQLSGHSNDGNHVPDPEYLQTHNNLSEIFEGCELGDVTYDSITFKHQCTTDNLTCKSVWLVIRDHSSGKDDHCSGQDDHYPEKRIDNASGLIHHTFDDLKPGHHYEVLVELRTLNPQSTVKDSYNIGHVKTKSVSINIQELGCNNVTVVFSDLDDDYEPTAFICCGKTTTTEQGLVTIDNLLPDCDYILSYGVIHNGKQLQQGQLNIRTLSAETELSPDTKCEESITEVFETSLQDVDNLITVMEKGKLLVMRVAAAIGFDQSFEVLKNNSISCQYKSTYQGLIANTSTYLDMNVITFLTMFESECQQEGFVVGSECEKLLTSDEEDLIAFYRLIEKAHTNCPSCQKFFHSKIHKSYYKDHFNK